MNISNNLNTIKNELPSNVKLVAVSKTKPNNDILEAYNTGQHIFGENRVLELVRKYDELPKDIGWHMIGHLQTNKVKLIASFVSLIHGVDSLKLLATINSEAKKNNRIIDVLLQIHIAQEETKFGLSYDEVMDILHSQAYRDMDNVRIKGLMGMATYTDDDNQVLAEFKYLADIFNKLSKNDMKKNDDFSELSMGMSGDYKIAIAAGSTMVRIGSSIFGTR